MASRGSALGPRVRQRLCCCFEHSVKHIEEQRATITLQHVSLTKSLSHTQSNISLCSARLLAIPDLEPIVFIPQVKHL